MQRVGSGGDHETQRQPIRRNEGGGLIDEGAYRGNTARPDHLCARDQGADPMRQIDQLLAGHSRKEVLVAAREAHHLVRKHWPNHDRYVGLGDMPVDPYVHRDVAHQAAGQLAQSMRANRAERRERLRYPGFVIEDGPAGIGLLRGARRVAQMMCQMVVTHPLMGPEGDHDGDLLRPAFEGRVRGPHELGQRACPSAIRYDKADALVIKVGAGERLRYESGDLIAGEFLVGTAHPVCARRVARIRAVVRRRFCRCRGRRICVGCFSAAHTSTVHPLQRQDKIASSRPKMIMTADVAAQQHGSGSSNPLKPRSARSSYAEMACWRWTREESLWSRPDCASSWSGTVKQSGLVTAGTPGVRISR